MTWANLVTAIRTVACLIVFVMAYSQSNELYNFIGLGIYWVLDLLDGFLARRFDQETRFGAQFDILADRLLVAYFYFNYVAFHPESIVPAALFLFNFMLVDHFLSNQFIRWPIQSPNYFAKVHQRIYSLNWSPLAKGVNSTLVTIVLVVTKDVVLASIVVSLIILVKLYSIVLLRGFEKGTIELHTATS